MFIAENAGLVTLLSLVMNAVKPPLHIIRNKGLNRHVFTTTKMAMWARRDRSLQDVIRSISLVPQSSSRRQGTGTCGHQSTPGEGRDRAAGKYTAEHTDSQAISKASVVRKEASSKMDYILQEGKHVDMLNFS